MALRERINAALVAATGYEIRRPPSAPKPVAAPPARADPTFSTEVDPAVDRLLRRPVFIMSPVRSGSTLLRLLLDGHSHLHSPHELHFRRLEVTSSTALAKRAMGRLGLDGGDLEHLLWDRVMHREVVRAGKSHIVEKTPSNAFVWQRIAACWPDARFVFLLRHPVSIARSWHEASPEKRSADEAAADALRYMKAVKRAQAGLSGHVVRYEELTADPAAELRKICDFLEIDWEPGMLSYGDRTGDLQKGLGDWKDKVRSGSVQPGRDLPSPEEVPDVLRPICRDWGYTGDRTPDGADAR